MIRSLVFPHHIFGQSIRSLYTEWVPLPSKRRSTAFRLRSLRASRCSLRLGRARDLRRSGRRTFGENPPPPPAFLHFCFLMGDKREPRGTTTRYVVFLDGGPLKNSPPLFWAENLHFLRGSTLKQDAPKSLEAGAGLPRAPLKLAPWCCSSGRWRGEWVHGMELIHMAVVVKTNGIPSR